MVGERPHGHYLGVATLKRDVLGIITANREADTSIVRDSMSDIPAFA